jgi:hypothetical protein
LSQTTTDSVYHVAEMKIQLVEFGGFLHPA